MSKPASLPLPMPALTPVPATYAALRREVEAVVIQGRRGIDRAWLHTYHETGRLIHEHLLLNKHRADYGGQVFPRLAADTGISPRTLHECAQFYRCFPIVRDRAQLGWSHYRLLCQVPDPAQRQALLAETIARGLSSPQVEQRVRALAPPEPAVIDVAAGTAPPRALAPKRGTVGVRQILATEEGLAVDLGFATYLDLPAGTPLTTGAFVQLEAADQIVAAPGATKADLFTYPAAVVKIVDGDTLWVKIYLLPGHWVKQKLRLRDLDCPELTTAEGKAAQRFTAALVARATAVTIRTTKPDKYDRYLADVFLTSPDGGDIFLNNALLENRHAVIKRAWEFSDWEPSLGR